MCARCANDFKTKSHQADYYPRWIKTIRRCAVKSCKSKDRITKCNILSSTEIEQVLKCSSLLSSGSGVLLCHQHYNQVHRSIPHNVDSYQHKKCAACLKSMKNSQPRYCSSPDQVQLQIKRQHDIDMTLTETDVICLSCYKTFCRILENPLSMRRRHWWLRLFAMCTRDREAWKWG